MKFVVVETQKNADGSVVTIATVHEGRNAAEQQYHNVLSYAAVSSLPCHSAIMFDECSNYVKAEAFVHEQPETEE